MIRSPFVLIFTLFSFGLLAQESDSTFKSLDIIEVKGLDFRSELYKIPASIHIIRQRELNRFSNTSLVPVLNTVPGVRMEERSPGSYRLSIRGSLLRSPFGVRNIKVYWKDMPLTDAGGNTYINLLDLNSIGRVEVLKGPSGSIYGAGTGGVVSFEGLSLGDSLKDGGFIQLAGGTYKSRNGAGAWQWNGPKGFIQVFQSYYSSDGYRQNSKMNRSVTQVSGNWRISQKQDLDYLMVYSDLDYRTPGGLTLSQFETDPQQARPATATLPSAEQQKAGVKNKTLLVGLSHSLKLSSSWRQVYSLNFTQTDFDNPFITNYEKRNENNLALRLKWVYEKLFSNNKFNYILGVESISGIHKIDSTGNKVGLPTGIKASDRVRANHSFLFTQGQLSLDDRLILNGGISLNSYGYNLTRTTPVDYRINPTFDPSILPRVSALIRLRKNVMFQLSLSKGFSSPTLSEIRPSAGGFFSDLQAEKGWNYETSLRGNLLGSKFRYEVTAFRFIIRDVIVRQLDSRGAEYFVNAGKVVQNGLETFFEGLIYHRSVGFVKYIRISNSSSFSRFRFQRYVSGNNDYSGNALTGVPTSVLNTGIDLGIRGGFYLNTNFNYTSSLPLSDANDVYAKDYRLLQARIGWKQNWGRSKTSTDLFISGDNLLNQQYSLGNDINAFGRRYYNPAPLMNWTAGIKVII